MKSKSIYLSNFIPDLLARKKNKKFSKNFELILKKMRYQKKNVNSIYNTIDDKYSFSFKENQLRSFKYFKKIALIGMGGSILGAEAIYNFLKKKIKKEVYFFDNIDVQKISRFKKNNRIDEVLFIVISKSGNTIETISNSLFLDIFKKDKKNIIIISERKNNILYTTSKKLNLFHIEHKKFIGGRFSVLSEVGLLPAMLMNLNVEKLRENLLKAGNKKILKSSSISLSKILLNKKFTNLVLINYSPELEKFLYWYQQLIAESLGKNGRGFLPIISNAPKDHHSLLQLYLDGPKDKIFHIFSFDESTNYKIKIKKLSHKADYLNNKTLTEIKNAQKNALIKTLKLNKIPFRETKIKNNNEQTLGELFTYFMLETIIVGELTGIDPFTQPAVEKVKELTKKFLK